MLYGKEDWFVCSRGWRRVIANPQSSCDQKREERGPNEIACSRRGCSYRECADVFRFALWVQCRLARTAFGKGGRGPNESGVSCNRCNQHGYFSIYRWASTVIDIFQKLKKNLFCIVKIIKNKRIRKTILSRL